MRQTVGILGTPIDILNTHAVLERLEQFIREQRFHQVATANTDFLINALSDPELSHILRVTDLVIPDGMPVIWASRLIKSPLQERVTGADIVPELASLASRKGSKIFMLGARPEIAQKAKERLEAKYPGVQIVGCLSPPNCPLIAMDNESILEEITAAKPDILLVAFGNPKQEKWIHMHREQLKDVSVCIGVGGTFDFLAGEVTRAPVWMQKSGLEWIFRLAQEPRRLWKRYVRDISHFGRYLFRQWYGLNRQNKSNRSDLFAAETGDVIVLSIMGDLIHSIIPRFQKATEDAFNSGKNLILDFSSVTSIDGEACGTLLNLPRRAAHKHCDICLVNVPPAIEKALRGSQIDETIYKTAPSVAQAFSTGRNLGLCWSVQCNENLAVITVYGSSERLTASRLEGVCLHLLETGRRIQIDLRGVIYADTALLSALYRLNGRNEDKPLVQIVPGGTVSAALLREKMASAFTLLDAPTNSGDLRPYETAMALESSMGNVQQTVGAQR